MSLFKGLSDDRRHSFFVGVHRDEDAALYQLPFLPLRCVLRQPKTNEGSRDSAVLHTCLFDVEGIHNAAGGDERARGADECGSNAGKQATALTAGPSALFLCLFVTGEIICGPLPRIQNRNVFP